MLKNTASQKWIVFAFDVTTNLPVTGDAAQITANLRLDGGAANDIDDTNPTELEDGYYIFDITAAESNGDLIVICPVSSTSDVQVIGVPGAVWTEPEDRKYPATLASGDVTGNINVKVAATDDIDFSNTQKASLATGVWDAVQTGHTVAGSFGLYLDEEISGIAAGSGLDAAETRAALGLASANLDTQLADIPTVSEFEARTQPTADYFDPTSDVVANVTLVDTTTTNTDMRGTDDAALATDLATIAGYLDTEIAAILADTNELELDWKNGGRLDLILDAIKAQVDALGTGSGSIAFVYTLTDSDTGLPIPNADVWATTDEAGANVVAAGITNLSGEVTFNLDADTYYIWRACSGYTFVNPDTEEVA